MASVRAHHQTCSTSLISCQQGDKRVAVYSNRLLTTARVDGWCWSRPFRPQSLRDALDWPLIFSKQIADLVSSLLFCSRDSDARALPVYTGASRRDWQLSSASWTPSLRAHCPPAFVPLGRCPWRVCCKFDRGRGGRGLLCSSVRHARRHSDRHQVDTAGQPSSNYILAKVCCETPQAGADLRCCQLCALLDYFEMANAMRVFAAQWSSGLRRH